MVCLQEAELSGSEVLSRNHVGVEAQIFIVCVLIASISLVAHGFNCQVRVIDFVHKVENS